MGFPTDDTLEILCLLAILALGLIWTWRGQKRGLRKPQQRQPRVRLSIPLIVNSPLTQEFSVTTYDISLSGAFLPYEDLRKSMNFTSLIGKRSGIKVGDMLDIQIPVGRFAKIRCQAKVVRYNFTHPEKRQQGVGIEFINISNRQRKFLETLIDQELQQEVA
jgi:c-di-GMP-binding flagellar brake protein YcgR